MQRTRRQVLATTAALGAVGLAGCAGFGGSRATPTGSLDIDIRNRTGTAETVAIRVTDSEGTSYEELLDETVPADVSRAYSVSVPGDRRYSIAVQGADWATGGTWDPAACPAYRFITTVTDDGEQPSVTAESVCDAD
jgi:hypothetical protein